MPTYREHLNRYKPPISGDCDEKSKLAWLTLGLGLGSWIVLPVIGAAAAVVCGCIERRKIAEGTSGAGGRPLVKLGMLLGSVQLGLCVLAVLAGLLVALMTLMGVAVG